MALAFHPLTPDRWPDLVELFGPSGAYSGCWCMYLRAPTREFEANCPNGGAPNKRRLHARVKAGEVPGLLGYRDGRPVGWVSVSPRSDYVRVLRSPVHKPLDGEAGVWAIACFFVAKSARGQGVADALLEAAVRYARKHGARIVEGYPIDTAGASRRSAEMWRGSAAQFLRAGFEIAARRKSARPIVRKRLRGKAPAQ
ncbi:MAG TPA: GNAT family N-acetyltransferase [Myxococcota bacterium]